MDDYETNQYLKKLGAEIREQTFWGLIPKLPEWDVTELGAYLPTISLPAFIQHLNVRRNWIPLSKSYTKNNFWVRLVTTVSENWRTAIKASKLN